MTTQLASLSAIAGVLSEVGPTLADMSTKVHKVTTEDLRERRAAILAELGITDGELQAKVEAGGLVGREWSAWSEIEDIDYLLAGD
jgi:hypothetical protein